MVSLIDCRELFRPRGQRTVGTAPEVNVRRVLRPESARPESDRAAEGVLAVGGRRASRSGSRWTARKASQRGFVTAETALVLPTLLGLGFALAFVIAAVADRIRCADAAWEAARILARGESSASAAQAVHQLAPHGASMTFGGSGGHVSVRVSTALAFGNVFLPVVHVDGNAQAACEPGTPCASVDGSAVGSADRRY